MSKNINFIPATELPEAEGDEVSVLCLENGELKQKAASGLGSGGGNTNYDIVVRIVTSYDEENNEVTATANIVSGSFDAVVQKLDAGVIPECLVIESGTSWNNAEIKRVYETNVCWYKYPGDEMPCIGFNGDGVYYYLYEDGTVELD